MVRPTRRPRLTPLRSCAASLVLGGLLHGCAASAANGTPDAANRPLLLVEDAFLFREWNRQATVEEPLQEDAALHLQAVSARSAELPASVAEYAADPAHWDVHPGSPLWGGPSDWDGRGNPYAASRTRQVLGVVPAGSELIVTRVKRFTHPELGTNWRFEARLLSGAWPDEVVWLPREFFVVPDDQTPQLQLDERHIRVAP